MENKREAAIEQTWRRFCGTYYDNHETVPVLHRTAIQMGFDAGAASVDRVEIVEKFEQVKAMVIRHIQVHDSCHDDACPTHQKLESALAEMDAVIAAMEEGK